MTEISPPLLSGRLWAVALVLAVAVVAYLVGRLVLGRIARPKYDFPERVAVRARRARRMLYRLWRYVVAAGIVLALLAILPQTSGQALALTGVTGALIVLATQALFRDVVAGFSIALEGQLAPGDRVRLFGVDVEGVVEDVGLRITVVREDDGSRVFIPNGSITAVRTLSGAASAKREEPPPPPESAEGGKGRRGDGGRGGGRRRSRSRGRGRGRGGGRRGDGPKERPPQRDEGSSGGRSGQNPPEGGSPEGAEEPEPPREVIDESPWSIE